MSLVKEVERMKMNMQSRVGRAGSAADEIDRVPYLLSFCNYQDEARSAIDKSIRQILNVFPNFKAEILQFYDNRQLVRFIQMRREIATPNLPPLTMFLMFPPTFPRTAPYFRVVNPNPQHFVLKPIFRQNQSKNDPKSMILNPLLFEVRAWTPEKSAVSIIIEINNLIRNNYPYQRIQDQGYQAWGNKQPQPILPIFPQSRDSPRINRSSSAETIAKGTDLFSRQKDKLNRLSYNYSRVLSNIQQLDALRVSIQSEEDHLRGQNCRMAGLISQSSSEFDVRAFITTKDRHSEQVLECYSSLKARNNVAVLIEEKFSQGIITLQQFMKLARRNQEQKFVEKYMLDKLLHQ